MNDKHTISFDTYQGLSKMSGMRYEGDEANVVLHTVLHHLQGEMANPVVTDQNLWLLFWKKVNEVGFVNKEIPLLEQQCIVK